MLIEVDLCYLEIARNVLSNIPKRCSWGSSKLNIFKHCFRRKWERKAKSVSFSCSSSFRDAIVAPYVDVSLPVHQSDSYHSLKTLQFNGVYSFGWDCKTFLEQDNFNRYRETGLYWLLVVTALVILKNSSSSVIWSWLVKAKSLQLAVFIAGLQFPSIEIRCECNPPKAKKTIKDG